MKKILLFSAMALSAATTAVGNQLTLDSAVLSKSGTLLESYSTETSYCTMSGSDYAAVSVMVVMDLTKLQTFSSKDPSASTAIFQLRDLNYNNTGNPFTGAGVAFSRFGQDVADPIAWLTWNGGKNGGYSYPSDSDIADGKIVFTMTVDPSKTTHLYAYSEATRELTAASTTGGGVAQHLDYDCLLLASDATIRSAIDSVYVFNSTLGETDIKSLSAAAILASIPEPATATLSLLALAGLAARRRRK